MGTAGNGTVRIADNLSVRGASHKSNDKPCQDASTSWSGEKYSAVIVCDGHGGDKYIFSAYGAKIACEVGRLILKEFMHKIYSGDSCLLTATNAEDRLTHLEQSIISTWRSRIEKRIEKENPIESSQFKKLEATDQQSLRKNPIKAYGCTFIVAVESEDFCFVLQLGDGNAVIFHADGTTEAPAELEDDTLQFNLTTSLCNSDAAQSFRHCFRMAGKEEICGITLTSDGIINSFRSQEAYESFVKNAFDAFGEDGAKIAKIDLKEALHTLSQKGSGDDLSFAIIREKR